MSLARRAMPVLLALGLAAALPARPQGPAAPTAAATPASQGIPFRKEATPGFDAGRWGLGVGAALAACALALWWLRRRTGLLLPGALGQALGSSPRTRRIRIVENQRISAHASLVLLEIDGRPVLIGEHSGGLVMLELPDATGGPARDGDALHDGGADAAAAVPVAPLREAPGA